MSQMAGARGFHSRAAPGQHVGCNGIESEYGETAVRLDPACRSVDHGVSDL